MTWLDDYRKHVERLARERIGEPVFNGSLEHASIIVEQIFKSAKKQVSILTGNLNARVYGRDKVVEEARLFLAHQDTNVRILMEDFDETSFHTHPLLQTLSSHLNLEVRVIPEKVRSSYPYHFLVMDSDSYRFEPDKNEHVAVAAFGDKKGALRMQPIFETLWRKASGASGRVQEQLVLVSGELVVLDEVST